MNFTGVELPEIHNLPYFAKKEMASSPVLIVLSYSLTASSINKAF
jgi:hypothetical protein